jgi:hypothetical protein
VTVGACLEKVGQGWRRGKPYIWRGLLWGLVGLVVAGVIWALIYVPKWQVPVCPPGQEGLPPKVCFDIENEARRTLAYILAGLLAIIGIYMAHRRIRALECQVQIGQEQLQVAQEGQITERFTRAIEQLGSDKMEIRLGGHLRPGAHRQRFGQGLLAHHGDPHCLCAGAGTMAATTS